MRIEIQMGGIRVPPLTARGERTEAEFISAAKRVFAEKGFFNAKITDICREAGKPAGSFYNYFKNKEELLSRLVQEFHDVVFEQIEFRPRGTASPYEDISELVKNYWATYKEYRATIIALVQISMTNPEFALQWKVIRQRALQNMITGVRRAQRNGFCEGADEEQVASAILCMIDSFCWTWIAHDGELGFRQIDEESAARTLADIWYRALYFPSDSAPS